MREESQIQFKEFVEEDIEGIIINMKHLPLTTIAAVVLVGCGPEKPDISIHNAVIFGNIQAVKQHLAAGTDVDMKGNLGETPLFRAFERQNIKMAKLLVDNGADVNAKEGG